MPMMTSRFDGKVALVTGAGSGMGRAITIRLTAEGASVLAVDIDGDRLDATKGVVSGTVSIRRADVSDPETCAELVGAAVSEFGRLDVIGNVAGIYIAGHVTETTVEEYRRLMSVNLDAYFFLAQAAIPHLLETEGNIVNIASNAGLQGAAAAELARAAGDPWIQEQADANLARLVPLAVLGSDVSGG